MKGFCRDCEHWDTMSQFEIHHYGLQREFRVSHNCLRHQGWRKQQHETCANGFKPADHMIPTKAR